MRVDSGLVTRGRVWVAVVVATMLLRACGSTVPTPVEYAGLDGEYVSVASGDTCMVLVLENDGSFLVVEEERDRRFERQMRPEATPVATGTWAFAAGRLALEGDGWKVLFEADSTRVEIPARADTLSSLRWLTSTEGSPFSACDLVSASEFNEFLNPTEGSGSSTGW
ncbi:MAG: hypothetical protein ABIE42_05355 [Candidatus Eisenbacteria bacterium]